MNREEFFKYFDEEKFEEKLNNAAAEALMARTIAIMDSKKPEIDDSQLGVEKLADMSRTATQFMIDKMKDMNEHSIAYADKQFRELNKNE